MGGIVLLTSVPHEGSSLGVGTELRPGENAYQLSTVQGVAGCATQDREWIQLAPVGTASRKDYITRGHISNIALSVECLWQD